MKRLAADSKKCSGCGACELACSKALFKVEDREKSAIRITARDEGGFDIAVCDQCGDCVWMCSAIALSIAPNGVVRLNRKACVGCLICIGECMRNYIFYNDEFQTPLKCSACGMCVKSCPTGALKIKE
ncbi:MAG: 4Fe-4S binding protein [Oscillospiraceae bacterium]|nr:4Fe-4S binding protein [Oscillospiraceae bacterium]